MHKYNSLEFTLNRRGSNWSTMASYRYSRLRGNFEGLLPRRQRPVGSGHLVPVRLPDERSELHVVRCPRIRVPGDIRFLGDTNGILPLDRPHQVKLYGNYTLASGLNLGGGLNLSRPAAAHADGCQPELPKRR